MSEQKKISSLQELSPEEVKDALISGLRARPNATSIYGAKGLTADELKKQYDKYPEILRAKLNELIKVLKKRFSVDENGITHVANDIYVKMADDTIATLSRAIFDISQSSKKADNALKTADSAVVVAGSALEIAHDAESVANEAHSLAKGAMSLSDGALGTANESKEIASDAYSYARTAEQDSAQAKSLAENAESLAKEARKEADDASSIAKGANQAIVFDSIYQMKDFIDNTKAKDIDTVTGKIIPNDGKYYAVVAVDRTIINIRYPEDDGEGGYNEIPSTSFPDSCNIVINYNDGITDSYEYNGYYGKSHVFSKEGRVYAIVPLRNGKTVKFISSEYYDGTYKVIGFSETTNQNATYRLITPTDTIVVAEEDGSNHTLITISTDDDTLHSLIYMYDIKIGTNLYIRDIGVPDYWWDGAKVQPLETQKVNLDEYADKDFVAKNYVPNATRQGIYAYDFIEKDENGNRIYGNKTINYSSDADTTGWRIVQRDGYGFINAKDPEDYNHVANKGYVDSSLVEVKNGLQSILDAINNMM